MAQLFAIFDAGHPAGRVVLGDCLGLVSRDASLGDAVWRLIAERLEPTDATTVAWIVRFLGCLLVCSCFFVLLLRDLLRRAVRRYVPYCLFDRDAPDPAVTGQTSDNGHSTPSLQVLDIRQG